MTSKCCGLDSVWVENVPGKGYHYCKECKLEVIEHDDSGRLTISPALGCNWCSHDWRVGYDPIGTPCICCIEEALIAVCEHAVILAESDQPERTELPSDTAEEA